MATKTDVNVSVNTDESAFEKEIRFEISQGSTYAQIMRMIDNTHHPIEERERYKNFAARLLL